MTTLDRLAKVLLKTYKVDPTALTADLRLEELGVDSLGVGLMLFDVEDEFKIKFNQDPGPLITLGDVVLYIDNVIDMQRHDAQLPAVPSVPII